ncbi:MAG: tRNA pseudouridine(55) synthase TruB [Peptococcaceae bacterium]|nr:tRNA pseudouridine(55) synthase TruB [Peptococcaceae bacterium]
MHSGFLNINKPRGFTSHDVVNKVRRIFGTKSVGHMGTLDPEASGVLPLALGKATRLIAFVEGSTKEYVGELVLGRATDTLDLQGEVLVTSDASHITIDAICAALPYFVGRQSQVPPMYSAIKVGGKKLYEYARAGVPVDVEPRQVVISALELDSVLLEGTRQVATLRISCGKGTYIRSLCRDIGVLLGVPACMGELTRTASGPFHIEHSVTLEKLSENPTQYVIGIVEMLKGNACVALDQGQAARFLQGQRIIIAEELVGECSVFCGTMFLGIGDIAQQVLSPKKVVAQEGDIL